jgi:protein-S-isoprenylcysteine O-methyltransferase Ste14
VLLPYAAVVAAAFAAFVHWYEEPTLAQQFGDRYQAYRRAVPGGWPRRHPWRPAGDG